MNGERPELVLTEGTLVEVARLANVWGQHGWSPVPASFLSQWCDESAALMPSLPDPEGAITLLLQLGLAVRSNDGIEPTNDLRQVGVANSIDAFTHELSECLLSALLGRSETETQLSDVLSHFRLREDKLVARWGRVPPPARSNPAWIWLQELGLAVHDGDYVTGDASLREFVLDLGTGRGAMSQAELDEELAKQRARSLAAELYVLAMERKRLLDEGAPDLAEAIVHMAVLDVGAGYDIRSFQASGEVKLVEVKSSASKRKRFFISQNEWDVAQREGGKYWLAWLSQSSHLPEGPCEVAWFRDPVRVVLASPSPWRRTASQYLVERVGDDSKVVSFMT